MDFYRQYSADDWLVLNGLQRGNVSRLLYAAQVPIRSYEKIAANSDLCAEIDESAAWHMVADAIAFLLPEANDAVRRIRDETPRRLLAHEGGSGQAFVLDRGCGTLPYVSCCYDWSPSGLLCIAHEFAHAVQIVASDHALMPPVAREVCAFLGEYAFVDWMKEQQPALADALKAIQCEDDFRYFGSDAETLAMAMRDQGAAYNYRWNYPVARWLADRIWSEGDHAFMALLFSSAAQAPELLRRILDCGTLNRSNPLSPFPQTHESEQPVVHVYRQMGAIALLDLEDRRKGERKNIDDYYAFLLQHMRSGRVLIRLDDKNRPTGYAAWDALIGDCVKPIRQCAPFGDQPQLLEALKSHLPAGTSISSSALAVSSVCAI